ncbi:RES domain-containing protein [Acuticoccus sediminis]|uniref:RES domain-containing protein n=1 Tax=Acuticoccus sediminis TaxID=2184697 RepID=A0A8B2NU11_9HYPH|nr:RES family NAD+ phosphorylase [Acuticoccus sediminis]RAI01989.1 RES domain-containing protein [Acuticoccus sediminis]
MASSVEGSVWRLTRPAYAPGLDGKGAKLVGGRWNSPGSAVVYCGSSLALCVLETFVHLPPMMRTVAALPPMAAIEIALPAAAATIAAESLGAFDPNDEAACRALGDAWIADGASLALSVPSAVVPQERNLILNVAHADMAAVTVLTDAPYSFDTRLATPLA